MNRNPITSVMKLHLRDRWGWMIIPWLILFSSFTINLIIAFLTDTEFYTGGLASIYIYMLVIGLICIPQTFPFAIGFSVRRKDYFAGTAVTIGAISITNSILLWFLSFMENRYAGWGTDLNFFHLPYISDGSPVEQIWINLSLLLNQFFLGFVIASLFRRFGRTGMYVFFTGMLLVLTIVIYLIGSNDLWKDIFEWFMDISAVELCSWMFVVTLIYMLISYRLLQKATI